MHLEVCDYIKYTKKYKKENIKPKKGYYRLSKIGEKRLVKAKPEDQDKVYIDFINNYTFRITLIKT